jgi:L-aspartate oxidase
VVARAIGERLAAGEPVYLDAREAVGEAFPERFPTVFAACRRAGLDPRREPLPVSPAAHYHMGGIDVDLAGRTSLPGLWACGEVASTGLHGANRLASNSLLEGLVFGARVADDLGRRLAAVPGSGREELSRLVAAVPAAAEPALAAGVRRRMWDGAGLVRTGEGLTALAAALGEVPLHAATADDPPASYETANLIAIGRLVTAAALARCESRGAHARADFPGQDPALARRLRWRLAADGALVAVAEAAGEHPAAASRVGGAR